MPESFTYGAMFGDLKDGKPLDALKKYWTSGSAAARTAAIGYWFTFGTTADLPTVQAFEGDGTKVPVCETDPDCKWSCEIAKEGGAREAKDIKTVGEFVRHCVVPAMQERKPEPPKPEPKK
jgi:hypothetical protein